MKDKNMTTIESELRFAGTDEQFVPAWSPETDEQKAVYAEMAHGAVEEIDSWLSYSPHNAGYLTSPHYLEPKAWLDQHGDAIEAELAYRLGEVSLDNAEVDLWHLTQDLSETDFAKLGIEDILQKASSLRPDMPVEEIDASSTHAISAMLLRGIYFRLLSANYPDKFPSQERDSYLWIFRQNILNTIRRASQFTTSRPETVRK